jgi:putative hemolysin
MHPPFVVPDRLSVLRLLDVMRERPVRMALVADEYGVILGLVTPADLLEAIAGDSALSPHEAIAPPVQRDDGSWLVDGMMPVDEFERLLGVVGLFQDGSFETVAGLVLSSLERLPQVGDMTERGLFSFEVVDLDGRRIDKVIVRRRDGASQ